MRKQFRHCLAQAFYRNRGYDVKRVYSFSTFGTAPAGYERCSGYAAASKVDPGTNRCSGSLLHFQNTLQDLREYSLSYFTNTIEYTLGSDKSSLICAITPILRSRARLHRQTLRAFQLSQKLCTPKLTGVDDGANIIFLRFYPCSLQSHVWS